MTLLDLYISVQSYSLFSDQVEVQSLLLAEAVGGASGNALKSTSKRFNKLWKEVKLNEFSLVSHTVSFKNLRSIYLIKNTVIL